MRLSLRTRQPQVSLSTGRFGQRFWPLFLIGLLGVATLPLIIMPMISAGTISEGLPDLSLPVLVSLSLINPVLFLTVGVALGAWLTPRLGLFSLIVNWRINGDSVWPHLRSVAPRAILLGVAFALATVLLDAFLEPLFSVEWLEAAGEAGEPGGAGPLIAGLLYGGITEELMLRWGMLSLVAWIVWRLGQRAEGPPSGAVLWVAIVVAALLFGAGHLPAVATLAPLDAVLVLRTIGLNALGGLLFGYLFCRYHLEAAMLAHASAHIGFAIIAWAGLLVTAAAP